MNRLQVFQAIKTFVQDLDDNYGKKNKPVALYNRLLQKTPIDNDDAINKHISAFKRFFEKNTGYVKTKTLSSKVIIKYSDRIHLDLFHILKRSDQETQYAIHRHLMTIFGLMNMGTSEAKEALNQLRENDLFNDIQIPASNEGNFLKGAMEQMIGQLSESTESTESDNPMALIQGMMQSGMLQNMMAGLQQGMESGELNIGGLFGAMTQVMGQMHGGSDVGGQGGLEGMMGMLSQGFMAPPQVQEVVDEPQVPQVEPQVSVVSDLAESEP